MPEQQELYDLKFLKGFIRRRRNVFLAVASVTITAAVLYAAFAPKIYISKATCLVEGQMSDQIAKGISTGQIEERLQSITQQIMGHDKLLEIIREYNLYRELKGPADEQIAVRDMREDISVRTIKAEDLDQRPSLARYNTVAFTVSYEGKDPVTVQKVASRLASLFIQKDIQTKEQIASQTVSILEQKVAELQQRTGVLERKLNDYKVAHAGELPEAIPFNYEQMNRINTQLDDLNQKIRNLEERRRNPDAAFANQAAPAPGTSFLSADPWTRLSQLRVQLANLQTRYSDKHPDVIKTKSEIRQIEARLGISSEQNEKQKRLEELKSQQAELKATLGPGHPEVVQLQEEIAALTRDLQKAKSAGTAADPTERELKRLTQERAELQKRLGEYQRKSQMAPLVQKEYSRIASEHDAALKQYNETMSKLSEVKLARGIDQTQLGERFTIIDEPQVPQKHDKPKRSRILLAGLLLSFIFGVFSSIVVERFDHSIKTVEELQKLTKKPVLIVFPVIKTKDEMAAENGRKKMTAMLDNLKNSVLRFKAGSGNS